MDAILDMGYSSSPDMSDGEGLSVLNQNITRLMSMLESPTQSDDQSDQSTPPSQRTSTALKDVIAFVDVRSDNENRSKAIAHELMQLGARIEEKFTDDVTHVIFKEGKKSTKHKACKKGVHLVSVLWVDGCKQCQSHVSEKLFPAKLPNATGTPVMFKRNKKLKSMQPKDFEEEVAHSADRAKKRRKKRDAQTEKCRVADTPGSPLHAVRWCVAETQDLTPREGSFFSPKITIPDTPPSMREKLNQLRKAQILKDADCLPDSPLVGLPEDQLLQRKLFDTDDCNSPSHSKESEQLLLELSSSTRDSSRSPQELPVSDDECQENPLSNDSNQEANSGEFKENITLDRSKSNQEVPIETQIDTFTTVSDTSHQKVDSKSKVTKKRKLFRTSDVTELLPELVEPTRASNLAQTKPSILETGQKEGHPNKRMTSKSKKPSKENNKQASLVVRGGKRKIEVSSSPIDEKEKFKRLKSDTKSNEFSNKLNGREEHRSSVLPNKNTDVRSRRKSALPGVINNKDRISKLNNESLTISRRRSAVPKLSGNVNDNSNVETPTNKSNVESVKLPTVSNNCEKLSEFDLLCRSTSRSQTPRRKSLRLSSITSHVGEPGLNKLTKSLQNVLVADCSETSNKIDSDEIALKNASNNSIDNSADLETRFNVNKRGRRKSVRFHSSEKEPDAETNSGSFLLGRKTSPRLTPSLDSEIENEANKLAPRTVLSAPPSCAGKRIVKQTNSRRKSTSSVMERVRVNSDDQTDAVQDRSRVNPDISGQTNSKFKKSIDARSEHQLASGSGVHSIVVAPDSLRTSEGPADTAHTAHSASSNSKMSLETKLRKTRRKSTRFRCSGEDETISNQESVSTDSSNNQTPVRSIMKESSLLRGLTNSRNSADEFISCRSRRSTKPLISLDLSVSDEEESDTVSSAHVSKRFKTNSESHSGSSDKNSKRRWKKVSIQSPDSEKPKRSLVMTSLHWDQQEMVSSVVKKLGGFHIEDRVKDSTTHVVCGGNRRTLNVLQAIVRGCWVVSLEWVFSSLEAGKWLEEEPYEQHEMFPAAQVSRLERLAGSEQFMSELFANNGNIFVSEDTVPPKPDLTNLLKQAGGQVINCSRKADLCIGKVVKSEVCTVSEKWILDCITAHQNLCLDNYKLAGG